MSWFSVDIEADGPIPGMYSMIAIGIVKVANPEVSFLAYLHPLHEAPWNPDALAVSGFSREETLAFPSAITAMINLQGFLAEHNELGTQPICAADNNGFDWSFLNWYFHFFLDTNPFGYSSRNINDIFHGLVKDARASFKHLRTTPHDHNPLNDALGNAEALLRMRDDLGFKVKY